MSVVQQWGRYEARLPGGRGVRLAVLLPRGRGQGTGEHVIMTNSLALPGGSCLAVPGGSYLALPGGSYLALPGGSYLAL